MKPEHVEMLSSLGLFISLVISEDVPLLNRDMVDWVPKLPPSLLVEALCYKDDFADFTPLRVRRQAVTLVSRLLDLAVGRLSSYSVVFGQGPSVEFSPLQNLKLWREIFCVRNPVRENFSASAVGQNIPVSAVSSEIMATRLCKARNLGWEVVKNLQVTPKQHMLTLSVHMSTLLQRISLESSSKMLGWV
ncbi:MAG: hypothetical protein M1825_003730 [Sarcosagium campestre]|nr:MAG: hypothetical protein M1825_003730 [Sarcosagium campestre]